MPGYESLNFKGFMTVRTYSYKTAAVASKLRFSLGNRALLLRDRALRLGDRVLWLGDRGL